DAISPPMAMLAKISRPRLPSVYPRARLFRLFDQARNRPVVWLSGPGGAGKTTAIASYLDARRLPTLWYEVDNGDVDAAAVFHYLAPAWGPGPRPGARVPRFSPELLASTPAFGRRFFESLFALAPPRFVLVFDNYQATEGDTLWDEVVRAAITALPPGARIFV